MLRLLAVASVVVYHAYPFDPGTFIVAPPPADSAARFAQGYISLALMRWALPFLGLVSGFLFFRTFTPTPQGYLAKLRSRTRTLLLPFLIWSGAGVLFALAFTASPYAAQSPYWTVDSLGQALDMWLLHPVIYPLWFLQALMTCMVLSPLVYLAVKWLRGWVLVPAAAWWVLGLQPMALWPWVSATAFPPFIVGAAIALLGWRMPFAHREAGQASGRMTGAGDRADDGAAAREGGRPVGRRRVRGRLARERRRVRRLRARSRALGARRAAPGGRARHLRRLDGGRPPPRPVLLDLHRGRPPTTPVRLDLYRGRPPTTPVRLDLHLSRPLPGPAAARPAHRGGALRRAALVLRVRDAGAGPLRLQEPGRARGRKRARARALPRAAGHRRGGGAGRRARAQAPGAASLRDHHRRPGAAGGAAAPGGAGGGSPRTRAGRRGPRVLVRATETPAAARELGAGELRSNTVRQGPAMCRQFGVRQRYARWDRVRANVRAEALCVRSSVRHPEAHIVSGVPSGVSGGPTCPPQSAEPHHEEIAEDR